MSTLRSLIFTSVLLVSLGGTTSFAQTEESSMLEQGMQQYQAGNYFFASTWFERILKKYPATAKREELLLLLSKSFASTGREEKAAQSLRALIKEFPKAIEKLDPRLRELASRPAPEAPAPATPPVTAPATAPGKAAVPNAAAAATLAAGVQAGTSVTSVPAAAAVTAAVPVANSPSKAQPKAPPKASSAAVRSGQSPISSLPALDELTDDYAPPAGSVVAAPVPAGAALPPVAAPASQVPPPVASAKVAPPAAQPSPVKLVPAQPAPLAPVTVAPLAAPPAVAAPAARPVVAPPVSPATPTVAALPRTLEPQPAPAASPEPAPAAAEYTLLIGEYSSKAAVNPLLKKLKKAGFEPELGPGPKKKEQMVRLYFGEFLRLDLAKKEIARLRGAKVEAFFLKEEDQIYRVYVGSYASEQGAELERRRLAAQGITLLPKRVSVLVPTYQLTLGSYPDRAKAREQLLELEKKGFSAELREVVTEVPAPQGQ